METKITRNTKYSHLNADEKRKKYIELTKRWVNDHMDIQRESNRKTKTKFCETCGKTFADIYQHNKTKKHINKLNCN